MRVIDLKEKSDKKFMQKDGVSEKNDHDFLILTTQSYTRAYSAWLNWNTGG